MRTTPTGSGLVVTPRNGLSLPPRSSQRALTAIQKDVGLGTPVISSKIVPSRISELWESSEKKKWRDALSSYWENPSVRKNLEVEEFMDKLHTEGIRRSDSKGWRAFLVVYFHWKFTGTYLGTRLADLESNQPERLFSVKKLLFESDPKNIQKALERARYIRGLGPAGASGLLAVLFPKWFGTVDRFVVNALLEVTTLPERYKLLKMMQRA